MSRRSSSSNREVALLGVVAAVVCCGLPLLLAAGAGVTVIGLGVQSWALIVAGCVAAISGFVLWQRAHTDRCQAEDASSVVRPRKP